MRNKDIEIIEEKELDIDYQFKSSTENIITIKSTDIKIKITQSDIYYLILSLKPKPKENNTKEKDKDSLMTFTTSNTTSNNFLENNLTTDILKQINNNYTGDLNTNNFFGLNGDFFNLNMNNGETNNGNSNNTPQKIINSNHEENKINNVMVLNNFFNEINKNNLNNNGNSNDNITNNQTTNSSSNTPQKNNDNIEKKLVMDLKINANIPSVNLCLCLNDYTKISEFLVLSSGFKINSITKASEIISDLTTTSEVDYQIFLGQLLLKYFDNNNNEIIMLNFEKSQKRNNNTYTHQIEINYNNNDISININRNEIIVRADSFLALYYYFKGSLPINEMMDFYHVEQTNKAMQFQINFNDSKFQLQTSFDGTENLHLDINSFVILYNSFDDGLFPYGNIFITLNTISTTLISNEQSRKLFYTKNDFLYIQITNAKLVA